MVTVTLHEYTSTVGPELAHQMRLASREAVNVSAKAVAKDGNDSLVRVLGPARKLSGMRRSKPISVKVTPAQSEERPVARLYARGPAHLIEHDRTGGYDIRPKQRASRGAPGARGRSLEDVFAQAGARVESGAAARKPALRMPDGAFRYAVKGGAITHPIAPITRSFERADATVRRNAEEQVVKVARKANP